MQFFIRLLITVCVIVFAAQIGRKFPTLAGLIAVMPLTTLVVLLWIYSENPGNYKLMTDYTKGVLWGMIPTLLFFFTALICFKRHLPLMTVLTASFAIWLIAAFLHQWLLNR